MPGAPANLKTNAKVAGILFVTATTATIISQIIAEPLLSDAGRLAAADGTSVRIASAAFFEVVNALASAGIAIALFVILNLCAPTAAVAYLGLRVIEGSLGIVAAAALLAAPAGTEWNATLVAFHDAVFLMVLLVFSISTFVLYPMLFRFRLVPSWVSVWGLIGGCLLILSVLFMVFGIHKIGAESDVALSLPIALNEIVLAIWLIWRGVDTAHWGVATSDA